MSAHEDFTRRLKDALGASGMDQEKLAEKAGMSAAAISQWFGGKPKDPEGLKAGNLFAVAKALGTSAEWLLYGHYPRGSAAGALAEADPSQFVVFPRLKGWLSAGNGHKAVDSNDRHPVGQAFRADFAQKMGWSPETHQTLRVAGDSMSPTIPPGASVVVDTSDTAIQNGKVYALNIAGQSFLKRIFTMPNGLWRVSSDNASPAYAAIDLAPSDVEVLGRAVHLSTLI